MKKLLFSALVGFAATAVQADYLLWTVSDDAVDEFDPDGEVSAIRVGKVANGSSLYAEGTPMTSYATANDSQGTTDGLSYSWNDGGWGGNGYVIDVSDMSADYSYYVELLSSSGEVIGRSVNDDGNYFSYSDLSTYFATATSIDGIPPNAQTWVASSFAAVPEPSSMALLALGAGLVGLRRKLRKNKKGKRA